MMNSNDNNGKKKNKQKTKNNNNNNNNNHPDDQTQPFEMTPGFKPFTITIVITINTEPIRDLM